MKTQFDNLRMVREQFVGMSFEFVSRRTGLGAERLAAVEAGSACPTMDELERLGALYGVDAELLEHEPIEPGDDVVRLVDVPGFRDLDDSERACVISVAMAARDLRTLKSMFMWSECFTLVESELDRFPLTEVPPERRAHVARLAAEAFTRGLITRASFAGYLGVSPLVEVELVVDHFGLDRPVA